MSSPFKAAVIALFGMLQLAVVSRAGVPPAYIDDSACTTCHAEIARSYRQVGMSRSFYRPRPADTIEDFKRLPYRHQASGDSMELRWKDDRLVFRRWQVDRAGRPINVFEQTVDWILGSGHHARTYLYQTPNGELYQFPLAWYSQTKEWGMAPGYDRRDNDGVVRRARLECMFCHNAYSEVAAETKNGYWRNQGLPKDLPEGIGCQRCHGPGAEHVRRAGSDADDAAVRAAIVRPTRLDPVLRNDVCYGCHMQPSVTVPGIRRFGRDIDSFRPGQPLPDYLLHLDIVDSGNARSDRFEINHHPYRLEQSRCFREGGRRLSCLSCHDPHRKVAEADRAEHYRAVCIGCHERAHRLTEDCTTCHMPKRRTQDVVHVVMTDHRIGVETNLSQLVAPRAEREPVLEGIEIRDPGRASADAELHRVVAAVRASSAAAAHRLQEMLAESPPAAIEPYFDLAAAQLRQKRYEAAEKTMRLVLGRVLDHPLALEFLALARANLGFRDEAIELLRKAAALDPQRVETQYNLGLQLEAQGNRAAAAEALRLALAGRPNFVLAWIHLGNVSSGADAVAAYRRALEVDPRSGTTYVKMARALRAVGQEPEAERYLQHGLTASLNPDVVRAELSRGDTPGER